MQFEVMLASCIIICDKLRYDLTNRENEKLSQIFALRWIGKDVCITLWSPKKIAKLSLSRAVGTKGQGDNRHPTPQILADHLTL